MPEFNLGLPRDKRVAFIKTLTPSRPHSRLISREELVQKGESFAERRQALLKDIRTSRRNLRFLQWNLEKLPECKHELWQLIRAEQQQIRATFDELVALKRWLGERVEHAEQIGLSD